MVEIQANKKITAEELITVFNSSGINRPIHDRARIQRMLDNSNILYTAWDHAHLVGILRGVSDMSYCTFVSDLAILKNYQGQGIGAQLVAALRKAQGENISTVLISAPSATRFYPKIGFEQVDQAFKQQRRY
ncbi:MAG: GNAT family N-acetyltransferase [Tetragenococcus sp.]|nr:GNAT family N-acetyltransferase [Tetragenococcus sp.]